MLIKRGTQQTHKKTERRWWQYSVNGNREKEDDLLGQLGRGNWEKEREADDAPVEKREQLWENDFQSSNISPLTHICRQKMDKTNTTTTTNGQMAETKEQSRKQNQSICRCVISGRSDDGVLKTTSKEQFSRNNSRSLLLRFKVLDRRRRKKKKKKTS